MGALKAKLWALCMGLSIFLMSFGGRAEPFPLSDLPGELVPWVPWVLDKAPESVCPMVSGEAVCLWPGEVILDFTDKGGSFSAWMYADRIVRAYLPGGQKNWPQDVAIDGKKSVVLADNNAPFVTLNAGDHRITGKFLWSEMPQTIAVPEQVALISLRMNGENVLFPQRSTDGALHLRRSGGSEDEGEKLDITVMRKLVDGIPLQIETRIVMRVSGKAREVSLKAALIPETVPLSVISSIPARLDEGGNLRVQVRAGTHTVALHSRTSKPQETMKSIARDFPWPQSEIWVWRSDESLRQAVVTGAPSIDPSRTNLPKEWHGLPAYMLQPGAFLKIETKRRGQPEPPPDQITLAREMWMDLDGDGYTARDRLQGKLGRSWRLDFEAKGILGHAALAGEDQLITANPKTKKPGVELRKKPLDLVAEWKIPGNTSDLPAVGWSEDVQYLETTLHLPPGWTLLFARGVDNLPGTWWDMWDLFGFFFVLVVSFAVGKLTSPVFGGIAFLALVISHHETDAPYAVWVSLLASLGVIKVLPQGRLRIAAKIWCWASLIWLTIVLVPFSIHQVRTGLFPQIEGESANLDFLLTADSPSRAEPPPPSQSMPGAVQQELRQAMIPDQPEELEALDALEEKGAGGLGDYRKDDSRKKLSTSIAKGKIQQQTMQQDPTAVVQTGPGIPNWQWNTMHLGWSGPVDKDHRFKLYLISPKINLVISILRVLLLILIGLRIASEMIRSLSPPGFGTKRSNSASNKAVASTALLMLLLQPADGLAVENPPETLLNELFDRITRPPQCRPDCVSVSKLEIRIGDNQIDLKTEVHSGDVTSVPLPGPAKNWLPRSVLVNGRPTLALASRADGFVHVRIDPGLHEIVATGPIPPGNTLTMELGLTPHHVVALAPGWIVEGIGEDGRCTGSIQLSRQASSAGARGDKTSFEEGVYPPWLEVHRTFDIGIPWLVHTHVKRVSPTGTPLLLRVPLVGGESVTESDLKVDNGEAVIALGRDDTDLYWSSTLEEQSKMKLVAPRDKPWTEIWTLKCSPVWQCAFSGLSPIDRSDGESFEPMFMPWPGESLELSLTKPLGVEGQSITIDAARLELSPGVRLVGAKLVMSIRASQGGVEEITLPVNATVSALRVGGQDRTFRAKSQKLSIALQPGTQSVEITWQQTGGIKSLYRVPKVKIGRVSANVEVVVNLPSNRWLLLAGGPSWGPAVLFWGYLLTILLAGLILGRMRFSPLKSWEWMLLSLGLTQVPAPLALVVVGWFLLLAWRAEQHFEKPVLLNGLQIVLALWTVIALGILVGAVYDGLAVQPDMQVEGAGSTNTRLVWYVDKIADAMPTPWILSTPILIWKLVMLAWALWLAGSIIRWAPWAWRSYSAGALWLTPPKKKTERAGANRPEKTAKVDEKDQTE